MRSALLAAATLALTPLAAQAQHAPITLTEMHGAWRTAHQQGLGAAVVINLTGADTYVWILDGAGRLVGESHLDPTPCEWPDCTDGAELSMGTVPGTYTVLVAPLTDAPVLERTVTVDADQWTEIDVVEK